MNFDLPEEQSHNFRHIPPCYPLIVCYDCRSKKRKTGHFFFNIIVFFFLITSNMKNTSMVSDFTTGRTQSKTVYIWAPFMVVLATYWFNSNVQVDLKLLLTFKPPVCVLVNSLLNKFIHSIYYLKQRGSISHQGIRRSSHVLLICLTVTTWGFTAWAGKRKKVFHTL